MLRLSFIILSIILYLTYCSGHKNGKWKIHSYKKVMRCLHQYRKHNPKIIPYQEFKFGGRHCSKWLKHCAVDKWYGRGEGNSEDEESGSDDAEITEKINNLSASPPNFLTNVFNFTQFDHSAKTHLQSTTRIMKKRSVVYSKAYDPEDEYGDYLDADVSNITRAKTDSVAEKLERLVPEYEKPLHPCYYRNGLTGNLFNKGYKEDTGHYEEDAYASNHVDVVLGSLEEKHYSKTTYKDYNYTESGYNIRGSKRSFNRITSFFVTD